jgi:MOSC domain-containing protein YiiM
MVIEIHIAPAARSPVVAVNEVEALVGRGLVGDRYADAAGTFSTWPRDHELTLIEAEAIDAIRAEAGVDLSGGRHRRNVTTRGVRVNDWVGRTFRIGGVLCRGTRPCPPCDHLQTLLAIPSLMAIMKNRGGLRAAIVEGGRFKVGDAVVPVD